MLNKLNGWLRIWLLLSVIWVGAMMFYAMTTAGEATREESSAKSHASRKEELRSEIKKINPIWTNLDAYEKYILRTTGKEPTRDPYVEQEKRRAFNELDKDLKKLYETTSRLSKIPVERLISEPESVKYYKQLINAHEMENIYESNSRVGAAMCRKRMWAVIAAALVTPFVLLFLLAMVMKVLRWIIRGFNVDKVSALTPAVFQGPAPAQALAFNHSTTPVPEAPTPVERAAISPGFSYTATVWVTGILLFINGFIAMRAYDSMQSHSGNGSLTSKPGGIDILLGCVLMFWRSKRTIYLPWAFWRATIGLIVMPILVGIGFFPTTEFGLIGYGMACMGLMTLTYHMKTLEDRLSTARIWTGTSLVLGGWIVGFVPL